VVAEDHEIINDGADSDHWDCCPGPEDIAAAIAMAVKFAVEEEGWVGGFLFGLNHFCTPHRAEDMGCGDKKVFCLKGSPEITNGLNKAHVPVESCVCEARHGESRRVHRMLQALQPLCCETGERSQF
jgi:hypothetical protein